ncbi:ferric/cupric-chelate reductase [Mortierella sp. GBA35]|nr:ferric/cupric-chelate reductase [Mortierella sp. GBA35]
MALEYYKVLAILLSLILIIFWIGDYSWLWITKREVLPVYNVGLRDYYFWAFCISPVILSHFVTVWGHYYRADSVFQDSVSRVSWPASLTLKERIKRNLNKVSIWEKKDSYFGYTVKFWLLSFVATAVNLVWFIQPISHNIGHAIEKGKDSLLAIWSAYIGFGSGYAAMGACGMILLLVLRRSMLHALGFTYADLLPLHRGMGFAIIFWSTLHTVGYMVHLGLDNALAEEINFDGTTRGPQNILGFVALAAMFAMGLLSLPSVRRRTYWVFIVSHRILTVISFAGTLMHYPYFMTWYYVVPSMCLYLADRFIPKIVQAFSVGRDVICSYDENSDILTVVVTSRDRMEPLKPYYPGDYINLQLRSINEIYHPFTIASYWAEDPYSMTLYIRTFGDNKDSWTRQLAAMCDQSGKSLILPMNVEGVFGDRMHDYLCADEIVIFAAGAAITTFMPLIKSIAAHIEAEAASGVAQKTLKMYLICTFRYESELYAYGDFLHQITHDTRFISWLRTDIHVSRADKIPLLASKSPAVAAAQGGNTGKYVPPASPTTSIETVTQDGEPQLLGDAKKTTVDTHLQIRQDQKYNDRALPTFLAADSGKVSTIHATRDLAITAAMLIIPFVAYIGIRYAPIEGPWWGADQEHGLVRHGQWNWCRDTEIFDQDMTNKCMWNYTMTPGVVQIAVACLVGYIWMYVARRATRREAEVAKTADNSAAYLESVLRAQIMEYDGTIPFSAMRLDVEKAIQELVSEDVGMGKTKAVNADMVGKTTTVFVGGPDGFLDSVEASSKKAPWSVDFHRETWSP